MKVHINKLSEIESIDLYEIFKLRFDVFVIEQQCFYDEFDGVDKDAIHIFIKNEKYVISYARLYEKEDFISFGRVAVHANERGKEYGKVIVQKCIEEAKKLWPHKVIQISAQEYLIKFYEDFGFEVISEAYDDDGIMHVDMILQ